MNKINVLKDALTARNDEVMMYQINIDNYKLAIEFIDKSGDEELIEFRTQLQNLLSTEILEQKKTSIMRDVIIHQLEN